MHSTKMIPEWANVVTFHPKHPKWDQNPKFAPQCEKMSITVTFIWESPLAWVARSKSLSRFGRNQFACPPLWYYHRGSLSNTNTKTSLKKWIRTASNFIALILDCKTVRIFAYSNTREQSNKRSGMRLKTESETGERRYGRVRLARFQRVRLLRHALPISLLILRKKPTVLQSTLIPSRWIKKKLAIFSRVEF